MSAVDGLKNALREMRRGLKPWIVLLGLGLGIAVLLVALLQGWAW